MKSQENVTSGAGLKNTRVDVRKRPFDATKQLAVVRTREELRTLM